MRDEPTDITLAEYRRLAAKQPRKRAKRADIPGAPRDEATGLTALMREGWSPQSPDCVRYRLYQFGGLDTGLCDTLKAACDKAKELSRQDQDGRAL